MKLIYQSGPQRGRIIKVGDHVAMPDGSVVEVDSFRPPHKPSSEGKVCVREVGCNRPGCAEYYVSVIWAKWVNREDRKPRNF